MKNSFLIGIDEAGRGSWAGPVVVAAVAGDSNKLSYCQDSKSISKNKMRLFYERILIDADQIGVGFSSSSYVDMYGLSAAVTNAAAIAFSSVSKQPWPIVIDGNYDFLKIRPKLTTTVVKADATVAQVSAASIVAKVSRDNYMIKAAKLYKSWGFESNVGYGTKQHMEGIDKHGLSKIHRLSVKPVAKYYEENNNGQIR